MNRTDPPLTPPVPDVARGVFSSRVPLAERYVGWLAGAGVERGLIGPRETPRLWERHLINCAVPAVVLGEGVQVCDVGSGAGLPGLVLAIARPDLRLTLVEPLLRRTNFLTEVVDDLRLSNVEVVRGRAEGQHGEREFDVVMSRAVAPLGRLVSWCLPLVKPHGTMLAMKGDSASDEVARDAEVLRSAGAGPAEILDLVDASGEFRATVVRIPWQDPQRVPLLSRRR